MVDILTTPATGSPKAKKERKTATKQSHPSTLIMVNTAVKELKERGGSSLQAIKKYMAATYKIDAEKLAPFIRKAIKSSVASGTIVQTKGKGASGSFKIAGATKTEAKKPATKPKVAKTKTVTITKPAAKKSPIAKKSPVAKRTAKPKKSPAKIPAVEAKSPSKVKKTTKVPTKKPKSPKAKTVKKAPKKK